MRPRLQSRTQRHNSSRPTAVPTPTASAPGHSFHLFYPHANLTSLLPSGSNPYHLRVFDDSNRPEQRLASSTVRATRRHSARLGPGPGSATRWWWHSNATTNTTSHAPPISQSARFATVPTSRAAASSRPRQDNDGHTDRHLSPASPSFTTTSIPSPLTQPRSCPLVPLRRSPAAGTEGGV